MGDGKWYAFDADDSDTHCDGPYDTEAAARAFADREGLPNVGQQRRLVAGDFPCPIDLDRLAEDHEENREDGLSLEVLDASREEWMALGDDLAATWNRWVERVLARHGKRATIIDWKCATETPGGGDRGRL